MDKDGVIKAKIVSVTTDTEDGLFTDSILLKFQDGKETKYKEFISPIIDTTGVRLWRRLLLGVLTGAKVEEGNPALKTFTAYKAQILNKDVYIGYDGEEVLAVGKTADVLFSPEAYNMWNDDDNI